MVGRKLILFCSVLLLVPGLSSARGTGFHQWGGVGTHIKPPPSNRSICKLEGVWKEKPYSRAWGEKRLKVAHRNGEELIQYSVHEFGIRGEVHETVSYNASKKTVQIFTYANPEIYAYATGKVSSDCRHITLFSHYSDFATRKSELSFLHR